MVRQPAADAAETVILGGHRELQMPGRVSSDLIGKDRFPVTLSGGSRRILPRKGFRGVNSRRNS
jgi:hypothetical protein